jgi:hypothetical protein
MPPLAILSNRIRGQYEAKPGGSDLGLSPNQISIGIN